MGKEKIVASERRNTEKALEALSKKRSSGGFIILVLLYVATSGLVSYTAGMRGSVDFLGGEIALYSFAGIFAAVSNICILFLAVYYGKKGFYTALAGLLVQIPMIMVGILVKHNYSSLPGAFTDVLTIIAIIIIYVNNNKIDKYQDRIKEQAVTDTLTGLPNRFACSELVNELIRRGEKFAIVSIDVNNFKSINDTMGHDAGNKALCEIAERWRNASEAKLSGTRDFITRQGGDEFALVIRDYGSEEDVVCSISYYQAALERKLTVDDCDFFVTASFGYAEFPADADNGDSLLSYADAAMQEVKRVNSGNRIMGFTKDILKLEKTLEIERELRNALEKGTMCFFLQPQYDINHNLRGFEALARMKNSEGGFVSPGEFIPVAEKVGLIDKVDLSVFRNASKFFGEAIKKTGTTATLSVNISARHLMKNDFLEEVRNVLESTGVPAEQLEIEITESVMIDSAEKALNCINGLRAMGVKIAIDDFGTGYSSLSYLNKFPANLLKIDKSFIDKMNTSESSKKYVAAIISIGHIMNFDVISEGVEEQEQLETLRSIDCDYIQGFIWGRPAPPEEAEALLVGNMLGKAVGADGSVKRS